MAMYAIKDTTLTALGDAVRSKVAGITVTEEVYETVILGKYSGPYQRETTIQAPKYRYVIDGYLNITNVSSSIFLRLGKNNNYGSFEVYETPYSGVRLYNEDFPLIIETIYPVIQLSFVTSYEDIKLQLDTTVIPLDENGNEFKYTPLEMAEKVNGLMTIPEEALTITGEASYRFTSNGWNWFIEQAGEKITTKDISAANHMFHYSDEIERIPFDINCISSTYYSYSNMFQYCRKLKELPRIIGMYPSALTYFLSNCENLREIPEDYCDTWIFDRIHTANSQIGNMFNTARSLRKIPANMLKNLWTPGTSGTYVVYYYGFNGCYCLDEIIGLPTAPGKFTSNVFSTTFDSCYRLKDVIFETNEDGTVKTAPWKSQTIDLSKNVGHAASSNSITGYNSGITADKEVSTNGTYQALKNDPDWWTRVAGYARYNHDSAVRTINSLPDCSATGTNTIKFQGACGEYTDGGAINTLTEAEIAVATAKGWVVSYV